SRQATNLPPRHRSGRAAHHGGVGLAQLAGLHDPAAQLALPLAGLVTVEVLLARLAAEDLALRRHAEPLLGSLVSFHLGHRRHPCVRNPRWKRKRAPGTTPGVPWSISSPVRWVYSTKTARRGQGQSALTLSAPAWPSSAGLPSTAPARSSRCRPASPACR